MEVNKSYPILEDFHIDKKLELYISHNYAKFLTPQLRDGVRFLYTQFRKERQGVILNDPILHLSVVQAMLFVNAILKSLLRMSLILCDQKDIKRFTALFNFWTDNHLSNIASVVFRSVCISDFEYLDRCKRKKWAILIIICNRNIAESYKKVSNLNANFKILITDWDVKANFDESIGIHNMINPTNEVAANLHKIAKRSFRHQIVFESILEDYVLRRNFNIPNPFTAEFTDNLGEMNKETYFSAYVEVMNNDENQLEKVLNIASVQVESNTKPAKNKDPTGLKVKRSKKSIEQTETVVTEHQKVEEDIVYVTRIENDRLIIPQQSFEDVETFIRNNRPIELEDVKSSDQEYHSDIEFDDLQMAIDDEKILQNLSPETVARDEGLTAENIDEIVMNTVNFTNGGGDRENDSGDNLKTSEIAHKINIDKRKSFDTNFEEIEDVLCKKYRGSVLDNLF